MNKPKGGEVAKVYSVRLEPKTYGAIVKKYGTLRKAIERLRERDINEILDKLSAVKSNLVR